MKMTKRALLCAVASVVASVTSVASGGEVFESGGVWYEALDARTCQVVATPADSVNYSGQVVVPTQAGPGQLRVVALADGAFSGCSALKAVRLPKSLRAVGDQAFSGCARLTSLRLPKAVQTIGAGAFAGCSSLASLTLGDALVSVGSKPFAKCEVLSDIRIVGQQTPPALAKQLPRGAAVSLLDK